MSDTPRTDAFDEKFTVDGIQYHVPTLNQLADFARGLERDLAATNEIIKELQYELQEVQLTLYAERRDSAEVETERDEWRECARLLYRETPHDSDEKALLMYNNLQTKYPKKL